MATASKTAPETQSEFKVIGTRPIRHDGVDKVTGRAQYGADVYLTGMLHGNVLRSPHAHARIVSIDAGKALALPGVKAVVTGQDLPDPGDKIANLGEAAAPLRHLSLNVLARDKVLYQGHAVAAVGGHRSSPGRGSRGLDRGGIRTASPRDGRDGGHEGRGAAAG
ncbi:MAG: hypothetical protein OXH11_05560 [Candidatus Aminicenantes bacterium]|nr:hypothetical protein [Candidatus Aminicenantes bacterium]